MDFDPLYDSKFDPNIYTLNVFFPHESYSCLPESVFMFFSNVSSDLDPLPPNHLA